MAKLNGKHIGDLPGTMKDYGGGAVPGGYFLCDGASYLVALYPALFAAIGYTYGGSGANFNVPNANGRTLVGAGNYTDSVSGSVTRTLGQNIGAEKHQLSVSEMPSHNHTMVNVYRSITFPNPSNNYPLGGNDGIDPKNYDTSFTGGGQSHNNMQPSLVVSKIIKF